MVKTKEEKNNYCIYIHTSPSGKAYIGITNQKPQHRWKEGKGYLYKTKYGEYKQPAIARAINKYGWDNFTHTIWAENLSKEQACKYEMALINLFDTRNPKCGYNICQGGSVGFAGCYLSDEARKKISDANKGNSSHTGATLSLESRAKIAEARKRNWQDEKYIQNQREKHKWQAGENHNMYGKHHREESKEKMSKSRTKFNVFCIELNRYFYNAKEAKRQIGVDPSDILRVCRGQKQSAGKHPETGEKLHWIIVSKEEYENAQNIII